MGASVKSHMDYAHELDLVVRPESSVPFLERELGYYVGSGFPLFSIGGGYFRHVLQQVLVGFHARRGYLIVETPILASSDLFKLSGHMDFYRKNMFVLDIEGKEYVVKPMNCPFHLLIFMSHLARYRGKVKLPFKVFEAGRVHRYEPSGSLYGLLRVRGFTQDDAHIVTPESDSRDVVFSVYEEMITLLDSLFNIKVNSENLYIRLSVSDKNLIGREFMGTVEEWEGAEGVLEKVSRHIEEAYKIRRSVGVGEAAFYGPKIDLMMVLKGEGGVKEWQMGTIQFDFNLPRRFKIYDAVKEIYGDLNVYVIHRALLGSIERFLGGYLEHFKGRLPVVLAPLQIAIMAIKTGEREVDEVIMDRSITLKSKLLEKGFRVALKETTKTSLSGDVRNIEYTMKPPIIAYMGAREVQRNSLTLAIFNYESFKRETETINYESMHNAADALESIVAAWEEKVAKIAGPVLRIPADLSHTI